MAKELRLWYDKEAPFGNENINRRSADVDDDGWEKWSLPIGNGYMGVNIFGRTYTERLQITENSMVNTYRTGGLNNFAETYIDFCHEHSAVTDYMRDLDINEAIAHVRYNYEGVEYTREIFASYPDKVMVLKVAASKKGKLTFTLRPTVPFIKDYSVEPNDCGGKIGKVVASGDTITLSGKMHFNNVLFEGQYKVISESGTMVSGDGTITVSGADSAVILLAVGTNYTLEDRVFTETDRLKKLVPYPHPHDKVTKTLLDASIKTYDELKNAHINDYQKYFSRVTFDIGGKVPAITTDKLLENYRNNVDDNKYLEEIYYQYSRYLLISCSRKGALPANLQGVWNQYDISPWGSGYWHNINVQMNYWLAFNSNLSEMFEPYVDYNAAYMKQAQTHASNFIKEIFPDKFEEGQGENGWFIGTGCYPYQVGGMSVKSHSGPGTGALTTKMFWDYYDFTRDPEILKTITFPVISNMAKFLSKVVEPYGDYLLTKYSASPEQRNGELHYRTVGCGFDQQTIWENHHDTIKAAEILGESNTLIETLNEQLNKLDPVQVGYSGQIKEYREEKYYGEIGDPKHRHISNLMALYPGTLINSDTPAWLDAAKVTLENRGDKSTGWAMAHRLNLWARVKDGERAFILYKKLLTTGTLTNLWDTHPPFQIDGNFGGTAGVTEMLLQSHEGFIEPLAAIPSCWNSGSYEGLVARGSFVVSAKWSNSQVEEFKILSRCGGECTVKFYNIDKAAVQTSDGMQISFSVVGQDKIRFDTVKGETYIIDSIPGYVKTIAPTNLKVEYIGNDTIKLSWDSSVDADTYTLYIAEESSPTYELVASGINETSYLLDVGSYKQHNIKYTLAVTAVAGNGRESARVYGTVIKSGTK